MRQNIPPSQVAGGDAVHQEVMSNYSGDELELTQRLVEERSMDAKNGPKKAANGREKRGQEGDQRGAMN